jgi:dolichyl-phosphate-mannose--protein O-mannosyl transferase
MLAAFLSLHAFFTAPPDRVAKPLLCLGLFLGLGIATKWNAAYASTLIGLAVVARALAVAVEARRNPELHGAWRAHLVWIPVGLILLPASVYLLAYVPFFLHGYTWANFVELQRQILSYHAHLKAKHPYQSFWWQWPLTLRPVWYHVQYGAGTLANIYANGNPILYWAFLPAVMALCRSARSRWPLGW